jgi:TRAP-type C4-dicarboxylate transport system substrate-binding protein
VKLLHVLPLLLVAATASAEPIRIRMAAVAPEGSSWAHEFHTVDRDVQRLTNGEVQLKWYLGGIAGDELTALERVRRGQLDGVAGAMFCDRLAPSMRVGRVVGLFQNRDEWDYVMSRLLPDFDKEFAQQGFANLGIGSFGNIMFFSRQPIRTLEELKRTRFWTYDLDQMSNTMLRQMGVDVAPGSLDAALKSYDDGKVDGFASTPTAALAFQWSARARYYLDITAGELPGCFVIADRAFDSLSTEHKRAVTNAVAKFVGRFHELGHLQDDQLLGGLFERQGLHRTVADPTLRAAFLASSRAAREQLSPELVPHALLTRTLGWLADYRSQHAAEAPAATATAAKATHR